MITLSLATACIVVYFWQDKIIFNPKKINPEGALPRPPELKRVGVKTSDGLDLQALYFPGDKTKPAVMWQHGNAYDIDQLGFVMKPYIDAKFPVYMTEYRGFGGNGGKLSEDGFINDIEAGWNFLKSRGHGDIVVHGFSMGCALSARFAATRRTPHALVLEAPFANLRSLITQTRRKLLPAARFLRYDMDTEKWVGRVNAPTLVVHGDSDRKVPVAGGRAVFDASAAAEKEMMVVQGGTHYLYQSGSIGPIMNWLRGLKCGR